MKAVKYGIRHDKGKIIALTEFQRGTKVPSEFLEISKKDYDKFLVFMANNLCCIYDAKKHELVAQPERKEALEAILKVSEMRLKLQLLKVEIELTQAIGDDPAGLNAEFNKLKKEYQELKKG